MDMITPRRMQCVSNAHRQAKLHIENHRSPTASCVLARRIGGETSGVESVDISELPVSMFLGSLNDTLAVTRRYSLH